MGWLSIWAWVLRVLSDGWQWLSKYQNSIVAFNSLVTTCAIIISLGVAYSQFRRAAHLQRRATSSQLWDAYLGRALQYPVFAFPQRFLERFDFENATIGGFAEEFERYEWFVSTLLRATDETIQEFGYADHRAQTALRNIRYHRRYLKWRSTQNNPEDYLKLVSKKLVAYIDKLVQSEKDFVAHESAVDLRSRSNTTLK